MEKEYEIFESLRDQSVIWRCCACGSQVALATLAELSKQTDNELFAIHLGSRTVIGRVNQAQSAAAD